MAGRLVAQSQKYWDFFADEVGDTAWGYESVLNVYLRIEDWHGAPDSKDHGVGGPVFVRRRSSSAVLVVATHT